MLRRRALLRAGGMTLAGLAVPRALCASGRPIEIGMRSDSRGARVWFDPVGLLIQPGRAVRWVNDGTNVHTSTAYHPDNDDHPLRIPEAAKPWDSGYLVEPGAAFEVTLTVEGVYDYFCQPHEAGGMVGRIIVGRPTGPGAGPFDAFLDDPAHAHWRNVPPAAQQAFPSIEEIMTKGEVRLA